MTRVNYISNYGLGHAVGGWDGVSAAVHQLLSENFLTTFVGPINPGDDYRAKVVSKLRRVGGLAGSFHFYSRDRLRSIARDVAQGVEKSADCDFFHGPTPWIMYDSPRPYFVYADTCFSTYVDLYHDRNQFLEGDLQRIFAAETRWLTRATGVFFGTHWAMDQAIHDYALSPANLSVVGAAGSMEIPAHDVYQGGRDFLFIAYDFERKGGRICAEAFSKVQARFPEARLMIVGGQPPAEIAAQPGVNWLGLLRKTDASELQKLRDLYASAFALVHPTSADIQPLVISEAGYFGCPAIAAKSFGIPELIKDGVTGLLIDPPLTADAFADCMLDLCADALSYSRTREAVRNYTVAEQTWVAVGSRIVARMSGELQRLESSVQPACGASS
jgi:glycosyltransferase involved in cell wall biosynthesis